MSSFNPSQLPSLAGKVAIVTGGNAGIGKFTVHHLLEKKAKVYLAARDLSKAHATIAEIKKTLPDAAVEALQLDLSSFASVKAAAETFQSAESDLHILVNNAGTVGLPFSLTADGYDVQWSTNYMGHYLLTRLLMPTLCRTAATAKDPVRIVNVSSDAHSMGPKGGIMFDNIDQAGASMISRYGHTKLANILHTKALAKRYGGRQNNMIVTTLHPGIVHTNLSGDMLGNFKIPGPLARLLSRIFFVTPDAGSWTSLYAAASTQVTFEDNGAYFLPVGKRTKASAEALDEALADRLWKWTEDELTKKGW